MVQISGGSKLEARLKELSKSVTKSATLSVGFFEDATYPDGTSVAMVAAVQEFGSSSRNIPPRPFFRNMIAEKSAKWPEAVTQLLKINDYDSTETMNQMGEAISGFLIQSIRDTNSPPLAPATVAAKGFDKPLIDTGVMIDSITYKVK